MPVFLITDIEGSTKKWEEFPDAMKKALQRHDEILQDTIAAHSGRIVKHTGDGVFAVFEKGNALSCAIAIQKQIQKEIWPQIGELRIRIGLHSGHAENRGDDFFGPAVNRTARIMAAAWGGQILLTPEVTQSLPVPEQAKIKDLGAHMLKDLGEPQHIFQLDHEGLPMHDFPALRSLSARPHNLPVQDTPFFGREEELDRLKALLSDNRCRLITLIGPGGMGKTRLALQAAAEQIEHFSHGVYMVALAPLTSANALVFSIAGAIKFSFYSREDEKIQLLNYLREKEILLILDNFEHMMGGVDLVKDMLDYAKNIKIMATSRELLNLRGENILSLQGMPFPDNGQDTIAQFSAIQLFLSNAKRIDHKFELTDDNRKSIVRVCQLVNGLPLGIELASSWIRHLPCEEIAGEIEKNMDFLATKQRDLPERHRSLRAIFDYSWDLLADTEREVLKKLSVFQRGFTRTAAEKITGATLPLLTALIDKSLLRSDRSGFYELSAMVRNYAGEKLREKGNKFLEICDVHARYYSQWLSELNCEVKRSLSPEQLEQVRRDLDNIRAAWQYSVENEKLPYIKSAIKNFFEFYRRYGFHKEAIELISTASERLMRYQSTDLYGILMRERGRFMISTSNLKAARLMLERSLSIFKSLHCDRETADTLLFLGEAMRLTGHVDDGRKCSDEAMALYRRNNDTYGTARALNDLAASFESIGDYHKAQQLAEQSLRIMRSLKDEYGIAHSLNILGMVTHGLGEYELSKKYYFESVEVSRGIKDKMGIARALNNVANIYGLLGDPEQAKKLYKECLVLFDEIGNLRGKAGALSNLGIIAQNQKQYEESNVFFKKALKICRDIDYKIGISSILTNMAVTAEKLMEIDKALTLQAEGLRIARKINDSWLIEVALITRASILERQDKLNEAKAVLGEAIEIAFEKDHKPFIIQAFIALGHVWRKEKKLDKALAIFLYAAGAAAINDPARQEILPIIAELEKEFDEDTRASIAAGAIQANLDHLVDIAIQDCRSTGGVTG